MNRTPLRSSPLPAIAAGLIAILLVACAPLSMNGQPTKPTMSGQAAQNEQALEGAGVDLGEELTAPRLIAQSPWAIQQPDAPWEHFGVPGKKATQFTYKLTDGRHAVAADARSSASLLRKTLRVEAKDLGALRFSWKVPALIEEADMSHRDKDDSPVRIVLAFDGDRSRFSPRDMLLAELSRAITGEEMPYATLMYVWSNQAPIGSVINNPRTDRIRKLVLESGAGSLGKWLDYDRDLRADFERAFGEPPGALIGIAIMTDSDNTRSRAQAWYGPIDLARPKARTSLASQ